MKWYDSLCITLILGALIALGLIATLDYNKTARLAYSLGYSNTQGWRK